MKSPEVPEGFRRREKNSEAQMVFPIKYGYKSLLNTFGLSWEDGIGNVSN